MSQVRKPIAEVVAACRDRLGAVGFKKRGGEIFTIDIADGVLGWLGLNRATGRTDGLLEINPVVGVRHQAIERMLAELKGERFHAYIPPTISLHVGYLMPEKRYHPWLFDGSNVSEMADAMVSAVETYGSPFMSQHSSLDTLAALMASGEVGIREQLAYRRPIAYHLLGDDERARSALMIACEEIGDRHDVAAERFRAFVAEFETRLGVGATPRR